MPKEYIEREVTIKKLKDNVIEMESHIYYPSNKGIPEDEIEDIVNEIPTADVVEVVRCKDCKYSSFIKSCSKYECSKSCGALKFSNDFCSYGAKMDKE